MDVCGAPRSSADLFMLVVGFRSAPRFTVSLFGRQGNFVNASFERLFLGQQGSSGCGSVAAVRCGLVAAVYTLRSRGVTQRKF